MNDFQIPGGRIISETDPYWSSTVFLLKPTLGAGSTSFVDDSLYRHSLSNANSVTKYRDNMFAPDGRYIYFNGSNNRLYKTDSLFTLGTRDFTIEFWILHIGGSAYGRVLAIGPNATLGSIFINRYNTSGGFLLELGKSGGYEQPFSNSSALPFNRWVHLAIVREEYAAYRWRAYINGVLTNTSSGFANRNLTASALTIGANTSGGELFQGFLAEIRITRGVARYKGSFTPQRFFPTT